MSYMACYTVKFRFEVVCPNGSSEYRSVAVKVLNAADSKDAAERVGHALERLIVVDDTDPTGIHIPET